MNGCRVLRKFNTFPPSTLVGSRVLPRTAPTNQRLVLPRAGFFCNFNCSDIYLRPDIATLTLRCVKACDRV